MLCGIVYGDCCIVPDAAGIVLNMEGIVPKLVWCGIGFAACSKGEVLCCCVIGLFLKILFALHG